MPLLLCPNCNTSMTAVNRQGVEFDMCPACRGVWLDRGELEKLVAGASEGQVRAPAPPPAPEASYRPAPPQRPYRDDDDDDDYRRHGSHKGRKKRFDLFDIFD